MEEITDIRELDYGEKALGVSTRDRFEQFLPEPITVSIVMPCLNEAESVGVCVERAQEALSASGIRGEVVVCDNGSTDGSPQIAAEKGARVVYQPKPGYGYAYQKGLRSARGKYLVMLDSDNTYDIAELPNFVKLLEDGYDVVMGNRFGGRMHPDAMPWLHRYVGNPILSGLLNMFFRTGIADAHCGMRAFTRKAFERMALQTGGMEFASEMVINAAKAGLRMTEISIGYYPREGESKLESFRDGWRHLRFMLLYSPTHLYLWPGVALMVVGFVLLFGLLLGPVRVLNVFFGLHWMFVGSLLAILGVQIISLGFYARVYSLSSHIDVTRDSLVRFFTSYFRLEHGIGVGAGILLVGIVPFLAILLLHLQGSIDIPTSVRLSILALTLMVIGAQTMFASFFVSMMVIKRNGWAS